MQIAKTCQAKRLDIVLEHLNKSNQQKLVIVYEQKNSNNYN